MIQSLIDVLSGRHVSVLDSGGNEDYRWTEIVLTDPTEHIILASRTYRDGTVLIRDANPEDVQKVHENPWYAWNHPRGLVVSIIDV